MHSKVPSGARHRGAVGVLLAVLATATYQVLSFVGAQRLRAARQQEAGSLKGRSASVGRRARWGWTAPKTKDGQPGLLERYSDEVAGMKEEVKVLTTDELIERRVEQRKNLMFARWGKSLRAEGQDMIYLTNKNQSKKDDLLRADSLITNRELKRRKKLEEKEEAERKAEEMQGQVVKGPWWSKRHSNRLRRMVSEYPGRTFKRHSASSAAKRYLNWKHPVGHFKGGKEAAAAEAAELSELRRQKMAEQEDDEFDDDDDLDFGDLDMLQDELDELEEEEEEEEAAKED